MANEESVPAKGGAAAITLLSLRPVSSDSTLSGVSQSLSGRHTKRLLIGPFQRKNRSPLIGARRIASNHESNIDLFVANQGYWE